MNPEREVIELRTNGTEVLGTTVDGVVRVRLPEGGVFHVRHTERGTVEVYVATGVKLDVITLG